MEADKVGIDFPFAASKITTISSFVAKKNKIETLQMEINSKIFEDDNLTKALIKTIDEYIKLIIKAKNSRLNNKVVNNISFYEKQFNNMESNKVFESVNNKSQILITAPHACSMIKEGKECYKEPSSGALVKTLCDNFGLSYCCKTKSTQQDSTEEYLECVTRLALKSKVKLIIEFHVMNPKRYEDITILTNKGFSVDNNFEIMSVIIKSLVLNKFTNFSLDYPFNALKFNSSIARIFKQTQIPSLQFIINQRIFNNKSKTNKLLRAIEYMLKKLDLII